MSNNYRQRYAIDKRNEQRLLKVNPKLTDESGIYVFVRQDENDFKYAYVGQAKHTLKRLVGHLSGYQQHIDRSLKKHGLYSTENPYGWNVQFATYPEDELDQWEQHWIKRFADMGFQLLNKTSGSQGQGKSQIAEYRPAKGYYDGLKQGRINLAKELKHIIDKHLIVTMKPEKENNKVSQKAFEKFNELLSEGSREDER